MRRGSDQLTGRGIGYLADTQRRRSCEYKALPAEKVKETSNLRVFFFKEKFKGGVGKAERKKEVILLGSGIFKESKHRRD